MSAIVSSILAVLASVLPLVQTSASVAKVIEALIQILPIAVQVAQDLVTPIKNIIDTLKQNPATNAEQLATLKALDEKVDAEFEAAATAAIAEDAAP